MTGTRKIHKRATGIPTSDMKEYKRIWERRDREKKLIKELEDAGIV
jgi:hypothetical protein